MLESAISVRSMISNPFNRIIQRSERKATKKGVNDMKLELKYCAM